MILQCLFFHHLVIFLCSILSFKTINVHLEKMLIVNNIKQADEQPESSCKYLQMMSTIMLTFVMSNLFTVCIKLFAEIFK